MTAGQRREMVLQAALIESTARGPDGTPAQDIARRAGISQAHLFRLFPAKKALFLSVVRRCFQQVGQVLATAAARPPGSVAVRRGQQVRAGQVIGRVGHTGNSIAPSLHFQLMDSADPLMARGISCAFAEYLIRRVRGGAGCAAVLVLLPPAVRGAAADRAAPYGLLHWPRWGRALSRRALAGAEARGQSPLCWPAAGPGLVGRWAVGG